MLPGHAQPCATRHGDLHRRALGDDRRKRRRGLDDLLEVVDDEQEPAPLELGDEALLEISLEVQQAERARDRCDNEARVADGLERHEDDTILEVLRGRPSDSEHEARFPDPSRAGDREQPDVVAPHETNLGVEVVSMDIRDQDQVWSGHSLKHFCSALRVAINGLSVKR